MSRIPPNRRKINFPPENRPKPPQLPPPTQKAGGPDGPPAARTIRRRVFQQKRSHQPQEQWGRRWQPQEPQRFQPVWQRQEPQPHEPQLPQEPHEPPQGPQPQERHGLQPQPRELLRTMPPSSRSGQTLFITPPPFGVAPPPSSFGHERGATPFYAADGPHVPRQTIAFSGNRDIIIKDMADRGRALPRKPAKPSGRM